jgi:hypothetical protein
MPADSGLANHPENLFGSIKLGISGFSDCELKVFGFITNKTIVF